MSPLNDAIAPDVDDEAKVLAWRLGWAIELGYSIPLAERLAVARHVDLHDVEALLKSGCDLVTAAQIVL